MPGAGLPAESPSALIQTRTFPRTLFLSLGDSGIFRSVDDGDSWVASSNGLPVETFRQLLNAPDAPATLYASVGSFSGGGLYRSDNGGQNWNQISIGNDLLDDFRTLAIDPSDPSILYAGHGERGVFESSDSGGSWEASSMGLTGLSVLALAIDPDNSETIYAGTLFNGGFRSTDGGYNWHLMEDLPLATVFDYQIHPTTSSTVFAVADSTVYRSLDGGDSWNMMNTGLPKAVRAMVIDPQNPSKLYAALFFVGVYRSLDGGATWAAAGNGLTEDRVISIAIDPVTPSTLFAGTLDGLFRTTDGADSWQAINNGLTELNIRPIAVDPGTPSTVYVGTFDGGAFRSRNGGDSWTAINTGLPGLIVIALAVDPSTPSTLYAGTFDNGIARSLNGGDTWQTSDSGLYNNNLETIVIDPTDPSILYAGTRRDGVYQCAPQDLFFPILMGDSTTFTGVALANDFQGPTRFEIEARAGEGFLQTYPDNPHQEILRPGKQIAKLGWQLFGVDARQGRDGWMRLSTDGARLASFFQFGTAGASGVTQLDGSVAIPELSTTLYFSRIYDGPQTFPVDSGAIDASTTLVVANPTDDAQTLTFELFDSSHSPNPDPVQRLIPALGCIRVRVIELFDLASVTGGFVRVGANRDGVVGFEYVSVGDSILGLNAGTRPSRTLFSAQLGHGTAGFAITTSLKVINTSDAGQLYTLEAYRDDGSRIYREILGAGANDSTEYNLGSLFDLGSVDLPATTGSIRITSEEPVFLADVMFGDPFEARFAAALPLQNRLLTRATFGQVANLNVGPPSQQTFTGLALYNPNLVEVRIRVTVFTAECEETGSTAIVLGRGERLSEVVSVLIPASAGQAGGYITLGSTHPVVAQVLFGNLLLDFLSAVPPTIFANGN